MIMRDSEQCVMSNLCIAKRNYLNAKHRWRDARYVFIVVKIYARHNNSNWLLLNTRHSFFSSLNFGANVAVWPKTRNWLCFCCSCKYIKTVFFFVKRMYLLTHVINVAWKLRRYPRRNGILDWMIFIGFCWQLVVDYPLLPISGWPRHLMPVVSTGGWVYCVFAVVLDWVIIHVLCKIEPGMTEWCGQ